jgi:hypothetical protein
LCIRMFPTEIILKPCPNKPSTSITMLDRSQIFTVPRKAPRGSKIFIVRHHKQQLTFVLA